MSHSTIQNVADESGVHRNTVARVLGGDERCAPETVEKVRLACLAVDYPWPVEAASLPTAKPQEPAEEVDKEYTYKLYETKPEDRDSASQLFTLQLLLKRPCEWEYDTDSAGHAIADTETAVEWEEVIRTIGFATKPSEAQIEAIAGNEIRLLK
jgi:hypothetical protein